MKRFIGKCILIVGQFLFFLAGTLNEWGYRLRPFQQSSQFVYSVGIACTPIFRLGHPYPLLGEGGANKRMVVERITMNVPCPGFISITTFMIGSVDMLNGGVMDAFAFAPQNFSAVSPRLIISETTDILIEGSYTGLVPPTYKENYRYLFTTSFSGPEVLE
jgi:hypothetical protein